MCQGCFNPRLFNIILNDRDLIKAKVVGEDRHPQDLMIGLVAPTCPALKPFLQMSYNVKGKGRSRSIRTSTFYTILPCSARATLRGGEREKKTVTSPPKKGPRPLTYINQNTQRASPEGMNLFEQFRSPVLNTLPKGYLCYRKPGVKLQEPWANKAITSQACRLCLVLEKVHLIQKKNLHPRSLT